MTRLFRSASCLLPLVLAFGCLTPATRAVIARDDDVADRQETFDKYRLRYKPSVWVSRWERSDGEYVFSELADAVGAYEESQDLFQAARFRSDMLEILSGASGILAGVTLGFNLVTPARIRMDTNTQIGAYSVSGLLFVAAIITALVWRDPADRLAEVYNDALRRDLGLNSF